MNKLETCGFTQPQHKFLYQVMFGTVKVQVLVPLQIARALAEEIRAKKTEERLLQDLGRRGLTYPSLTVLPRLARPRLGSNAVLLVDLTVVQKPYGGKMGGHKRVWDGSTRRAASG